MFKNMGIKSKLFILVLAIILPLSILRAFYVLKQHKDFMSEYYMRSGSLCQKVLTEEIIILGSMLFILILSLVILFHHYKKHFISLRDTAMKIKDGDYSVRTKIKGNDEISKMAEAFDSMAKSLETCKRESMAAITSISHDTKTPINVILSSLQLIDVYSKNLDCQEFKRKVPTQINLIRQNCYRLMRLTNNIIDIYRHDNGYLTAQLTNYDIVELVKEISLSVKKYVEMKGLNLLFESEIPQKTIACDPDMIERILLNLISNAIKFTDKDGVIKVILTEKSDNIVISVMDTGTGIAEEKLSRLFGIFNKDENPIRNKEGTGMGLYLVKTFVEAHGGKILVHSEKAKGTQFDVFLPIKTLDEASHFINENQSGYNQGMTYNGVQRKNIEFSDIYSCFEHEIS